MNKPSFEIKLPASLLQLGLTREEIEHRVTEWLVLSMFSEERISSGKAANLLNLNRIQFIDLLRSRGIAYVDYNSEEMGNEIESGGRLTV